LKAVAIAHEPSHVVLDSIAHPIRQDIEETVKNTRHPKTTLLISVDDDDAQTKDMLGGWREINHEAVPVHYCVWTREDTLGAKYNRILTMAPDADVYLAMVDYAPHITPGFDQKILDAAELFEDGIGVIYNHLANLSFPAD
jgi:hypothetical protein